MRLKFPAVVQCLMVRYSHRTLKLSHKTTKCENIEEVENY